MARLSSSSSSPFDSKPFQFLLVPPFLLFSPSAKVSLEPLPATNVKMPLVRSHLVPTNPPSPSAFFQAALFADLVKKSAAWLLAELTFPRQIQVFWRFSLLLLLNMGLSVFLDLFFPFSWHKVRLELINFTMVNYDEKQGRRRKNMHRFITRY